LPLGVVDPAASYRNGLSVALSTAGFAATEVADPRAWGATAGRRVLLWTVRSPEDWKGFKALRGLNPELVLVALLVDLTPDAYAEALRSGAVAAVAWEAARRTSSRSSLQPWRAVPSSPPGSLRLWRRNFPPLRIGTG